MPLNPKTSILQSLYLVSDTFTMNSVDHFRSLHRLPAPLLIGNAWNVASARAFANLKFVAIATSSAAVAESMGYHDGEEMPFDEYFHIVKRIRATIDLPLSVDMETGFGKTTRDVVDNLVRLAELGVVGVNLEDSRIVDGKRTLTDPTAFADRMTDIRSKLQDRRTDLFINLRCDPFLMRMAGAKDETLRRLAIYETLAVDGVFVACAVNLADIEAVTRATRHPVNVLCMPGLPTFQQLQEVGVKRISMGDFAFEYLYRQLEHTTREVVREASFQRFFS